MSSARIIRAARPLTFSSRRLFTTTLRTMAEGDTGSTRSGGAAQGDAFTKREKGNEDYFIRQAEQEKLAALREKLKEGKQHLEQLDKHIQELSKNSGGQGEQN